MSEAEASYDRRGGLLNVVDIVVAPPAAFARLRVAPAWGWTFVAAALLAIAGILLMDPVTLHVFDRTAAETYAALPSIEHLPAERRAAAVEKMVGIGRTMIRVGWVMVPFGMLLGALISSLVMLLANALTHGDGDFRRFWALAMATAVVGSLGLFLTGVIVALRGPDAFGTQADVQHALPSLALLAPGAPPKIAAFLGMFSVTAIWSTVLLALGMTAVARIPRLPAALAAAVLLLGPAVLAASFTPA